MENKRHTDRELDDLGISKETQRLIREGEAMEDDRARRGVKLVPAPGQDPGEATLMMEVPIAEKTFPLTKPKALLACAALKFSENENLIAASRFRLANPFSPSPHLGDAFEQRAWQYKELAEELAALIDADDREVDAAKLSTT